MEIFNILGGFIMTVAFIIMLIGGIASAVHGTGVVIAFGVAIFTFGLLISALGEKGVK